MTDRQTIAFNHPLFSLFQLTDSQALYRVDKQLPTGIYISTYLTVDAYETPFAWHVAVGYARRVTMRRHNPDAVIRVEHWDDEMTVIAMNTAAELLVGVGTQDGGEHWDKAEIHELSFQAWRRLSAEEYLYIDAQRVDQASAIKLFPVGWESLQRSIRVKEH